MRNVRPSALIVLLVGLAACRGDLTASVSRSVRAIMLGHDVFDAHPFYGVEGKVIPLQADPREFTLETTGDLDSAAVDRMLTSHGISATSIARLGGLPQHWLVAAGAVAGARPRAAIGSLRSDPLVRFAEPVYRVGPRASRMRLLNRVVVAFTGQPSRDLARGFEAEYDLEREAHVWPAQYRFRLRAGSSTCALALAAHLETLPFVAWATIDFIGDGGLGASGPAWTAR